MPFLQAQAYEARLEGIAANVPALLFELQRHVDGSLEYLFNSRAVSAVCGDNSDPAETAWLPCIHNLHAADRSSFFTAMAHSAREITHWNWEGRIIVPPGDLKWINLRAAPRLMPDGSVVWDGIILNITLSKQREDESQHAREILEGLSAHIQRAREDERTRIAREIHDELGGILTTLKMDLGWLAKRIETPALLERADTMTQLTVQALQTARRISADLRPPALDNLGLVAALESYAQATLGRMDIVCRFTPPEQEPELDNARASAIFRIFQESLTNIVRHARAHLVSIELIMGDHDLEVIIHDDGNGLASNPTPSYGILGMRERAKQLGGNLTIRGAAGQGTTVHLIVPLRVEESSLP